VEVPSEVDLAGSISKILLEKEYPVQWFSGIYGKREPVVKILFGGPGSRVIAEETTFGAPLAYCNEIHPNNGLCCGC